MSDSFYVVTDSSTTDGIVVETFFISNPEELAKYQARKWPVASAIVEAMLA